MQMSDKFTFEEFVGKKKKRQQGVQEEFNAKILIGLPYPDPRQRNCNNIISDFSNDSCRIAAVDSLLKQIKKKWQNMSYDKLKLIGFYWIQ